MAEHENAPRKKSGGDQKESAQNAPPLENLIPFNVTLIKSKSNKSKDPHNHNVYLITWENVICR